MRDNSHSASGSGSQTTAAMAARHVGESEVGRIATRTPSHGETKGVGATRKERCGGAKQKIVHIPGAFTGVASRAIAACDCGALGLLGLFSSWQRWPISRLMLTMCVVRKTQSASRSRPWITGAGSEKGEGRGSRRDQGAGRSAGRLRKRHSPSLARPPFITSHMTPSAVQAGVVYLAPSGRLCRASPAISQNLLLALTFVVHFWSCRGGWNGG